VLWGGMYGTVLLCYRVVCLGLCCCVMGWYVWDCVVVLWGSMSGTVLLCYGVVVCLGLCCVMG
jgi:hypothetical protein